jgi:hypothetical protein
MTENESSFDGLAIGSTDAWIHRQFMEGCDELCFTYRREVEHLRELASELQQLPSRERRQHTRTLRKWRKIEQLEMARLKAS